jgi:hypothetical protein
MEIISPIIEECFMHFVRHLNLKTYNIDPDLRIQLTLLNGNDIQLLLLSYVKNNNDYSIKTWFYIICDFLKYCNNIFNINIEFDDYYETFSYANDLNNLTHFNEPTIINDYTHLFKKNVNYSEFMNMKLINNNKQYKHLNVYWAIPKYDNFGKLLKFRQMTLIGNAMTIGDLYNHIGSDLYNTIKSSKLIVRHYSFGICIECY